LTSQEVVPRRRPWFIKMAILIRWDE